MKTIITLLVFIFFVTSFAFSQAKKVDNFKSGDDNVEVFFYDPLLALFKLDKDFLAKTDKQKSDALDKYLHENPLYLFRLTNVKTKEVRYLCIRGNPKIVNTKMFYKVEVIKNVQSDFDPTENNYSDKIVQVIDQVNCGGTLFENMSLFDGEEERKAVGNGILVFGYYRRVQPYSEIKKSVISIMQKLQEK